MNLEAVKLVAIVNSFNRLSLLKVGFPSLVEALKGCPFRSAIVVFEAGSTDGSYEWLEAFRDDHPYCRIDILPGNPAEDTSFSAGVNKACAYAAEQYPSLEHYFLFETDNWIQSSKPLLEGIEFLKSHLNVAASGFTVFDHEGQRVGYGASFPTVGQLILGRELSHWLGLDRPKSKRWRLFQKTTWSFCEVVYTSPLLVKREAWEQSEGLDASTFPFSECDVDWAWRLRKVGWRLVVLRMKGVVHDNRQNLSSWSEKRVLYFYHARLQLLRRHLGNWVGWLKPLFFLRHCLELIGVVLMFPFLKQKKNSFKKRWVLLQTVFNNYCYETE